MYYFCINRLEEQELAWIQLQDSKSFCKYFMNYFRINRLEEWEQDTAVRREAYLDPATKL